MRAVEALIVLAVVGAVAFAIGVRLLRAGVRWWQRRRASHQPWQMVEHSDGELVSVLASKPGDDDLLIGAVPFSAADFDAQLYELRAEGRQKVYALNEAEK